MHFFYKSFEISLCIVLEINAIIFSLVERLVIFEFFFQKFQNSNLNNNFTPVSSLTLFQLYYLGD
jgi:hypothetical protein